MMKQAARTLGAAFVAVLLAMSLPSKIRADDASDILTAGTAYLSKYVFGKSVTTDTFDERIIGRWAIVDWLRGNAAGEMFLQHQASGWTVVRAGGGQMSPEMLTNWGVSPTNAATLLHTCPPAKRVPLSVSHGVRRARSASRCAL